MRAFVCATFVVSALAAYACSSFEESSTSPANDAGSDATDGDAPADVAVDQSSGCQGEPAWVTPDAGQANVTCDGEAVSLLNHPKHCGRCNHSCGPDSCVAGKCSEQVHDVQASAIPFGVHDGVIYYARRPPFSAPHEIKKLVPGDAPVLLGSLAEAADAGTGINAVGGAVIGDFVYVRTNKALRRASITGPSSALPELVMDLPEEGISTVTTDGVRLFIATPSASRVDEVSLDGGVTPFIGVASHPGEARFVDGGYYWITQPWIFIAGGPSIVHSRVGGTDRTLYESQDKVGGLAIDGNDLYVMRASPSGAIVRIDLTTGATAPFYEGALDNNLFTVAVAVDATHVYWLKGTGAFGATAEIWKRARCGGEAVHLGTHQGAYRLVALGDRLYIGADDGLFSIAK